MARASSISIDYLIRGFRRRFGISPMAWRRRAALEHAVHLLSTGLSVKAVAPQLGFLDASAFTRAFRRQFGQSPTAYLRHGPPSVPRPPEGTSLLLNRHLRPHDAVGSFTWG